MGFSGSLGWAHSLSCLLLTMIMLAEWSLSSENLVAQGRVLPRVMLESGEARMSKASVVTGEVVEEEKILLRARIGSRPPACERRCGTCGRCEPVQVPAVPQARKRHASTVSAINSRGEDNTNYKPMNWKCKCGDMIFNPRY